MLICACIPCWPVIIPMPDWTPDAHAMFPVAEIVLNDFSDADAYVDFVVAAA